MAITTMDGVVAGLASARNAVFLQSSTVSTSSNTFLNLQKASTTSFGLMATPAAASSGGTLHTHDDAGFPKLPAPSGVRYLAGVDITALNTGTIFVYDRVWSCSGFSGTMAGAQAVTGFPALTRPDVNGTGLELWVECYTATGPSPSNITVQYTNTAGTSGRNTISVSHPTPMPAGRMYNVNLQSGDAGVKSIESVTLSASTGTAGNFGVSLMRRLAVIPISVVSVTNSMDFASVKMPVVQENAAINLVHLATGGTIGNILGNLVFIEG